MSGRKGGPQRVALLDPGDFTPHYDAELAKGLIRTGCQVKLFTEAGNSEAVPAPYRCGHFYKPLAGAAGRRLPKRGARVLKGLCHLPDMAALRPALGAFGAEVLHCQWAPLPLIDRWAFRWLRRRLPIVLTLHDSNPYNGAANSLMRAGHRSMLQEADAIIVHTRQALDRLTSQWGLDPATVHQVPCGLFDVPAWSPDVPSRSVSGPLVLLLFGKIKHYKGVDILLQAVARLPPEVRTRLKVRIVGEPHLDTAPFQRFAAEHGLGETVQFRFEFVTEAEIGQLIAEADAMVLPYREIDASGIAMTAVASGLPVLASAVDGFAELFADGAGARLVPPNDPEALAAVLREWAEAPQTLVDLRSAMRARRDAFPSWDEIARRTRAVYAEARSRWAHEHDGSRIMSLQGADQ